MSVVKIKDDMILFINQAYERKYNVPDYILKNKLRDNSDYDFKKYKDVIEGENIFLLKPHGIEIVYTVYWTGNKIKGGFISICNNYTHVDRGDKQLDNGKTVFAGHIPELKKCIRNETIRDVPGWYSVHAIFDGDKFIFWGKKNIADEYFFIKELSGVDDYVEYGDQLADKNIYTPKPEGWVVSMKIHEGNASLNIMELNSQSVTAAWKILYEKAGKLPRTITFTNGLDKFMQRSYAVLMNSKKIT